MDVELLVTGDEMVDGRVVDTNSPWLLARLLALGVRVRRVTAVGDVAADLESALADASKRSDLLVISGGLGPTSDDLTAACAAKAAGVPLVIDGPTLGRIRERYAARGRAITPAAEKQAEVPQGAVILVNDEGTAPGFRRRIGRAECFFFAGVPREFKHLCARHLLPFVQARTTRTVLSRTFRCAGVPESELDSLLLPIAKTHGLRLGLRATWPEAWATLSVEATTSEEAHSLLDPAIDEAANVLGIKAFSSRGETLAEVVGGLLRERGATVSFAESCTGGLLGGALTAVPGSSRYVLGGVVAYANEEKTRALGVSPALLAQHGAVSEPVVRAMADGARTRLGSTYSLAITGVAGPGGGTPEKPVGTVWIAFAGPSGVVTQLLRSVRLDRDSIREASVTAALDLLRRTLVETG